MIAEDNGNNINLQTLVNITHTAFPIKRQSHEGAVTFNHSHLQPGPRLLQTVLHP